MEATATSSRSHVVTKEIAPAARDDGEVEGEALDLPPLTSEKNEKCSGGETRTHNLAVNSRLLCH